MKWSSMLAALIAMSCSKQPMEIHKLDIRDSTILDRPILATRVNESYVVSNPPVFDSLVPALLQDALSKPTRYPTRAFQISRAYYRESRDTPRDFRETNERFGGIDAHVDDFLATILHNKSETRDCWFVIAPVLKSPSRWDTCVDLAPVPIDSAKAAPATSSMETP